MQKEDKQRVVAELTERLRNSETVIVADYRGLTNSQIDGLRTTLLEHGARFSVVKNTLTRRAAQEAGAGQLRALLEGPSAIAFLETGGDAVAVAKALRDAARDTRILAIRGGVLEGRAMTADEVENLATLPPAEVLRAQLLGAITAPLTTVVGLFTAPLRDLVGLIDARIEQLRERGDTGEPPAVGGPAPGDTQPEASAEPAGEETQPEAPAAEGESTGETPPDESQQEDTQNAAAEEGEES